MTYIDKIKGSKEMFNAITSLKDNEVMEVVYGTKYNGEPRVFSIHAYVDYKGEINYSINDGILNGMNISKMSKTSLHAYTYDMMGQKTTYTFPLWEMKTGLVIKEDGQPSGK